jgi:hypothetical protein
MESGKIFLVALISVISTYAAITAWPAVKELFNPMNGSAAAASTPATAVTPPTRPAAAPPAQTIPAVQSMSQPVGGRVRVQQASVQPLSSPRLSTIPWNINDLKYAKRSIVMRARPGGEPLKAVSLNKAGLTILRGTRLMPVKNQGEWVMVQSPSALLGWVRAKELTSERPVVGDHFALRAPTE